MLQSKEDSTIMPDLGDRSIEIDHIDERQSNEEACSIAVRRESGNTVGYFRNGRNSSRSNAQKKSQGQPFRVHKIKLSAFANVTSMERLRN